MSCEIPIIGVKPKRLCVCNNVLQSEFIKRVESGAQLPEIIEELSIGTKCGTCWSEAHRVYKKHKTIKES